MEGKQNFKFCELEHYNIFEKGFRRITDKDFSYGKIEPVLEKFVKPNNKYKEELSKSEINRITEIMHDLLVRFEYA